MIQISEQQLKTLAGASRLQFEADMVQMVREFYAEQVESLCAGSDPPDPLPALITTLVQRAHGYALDDDADVERFIELCFEYGPGFEHEPPMTWAGEILRGPSSSGAAKIAKIDRCLYADQ